MSATGGKRGRPRRQVSAGGRIEETCPADDGTECATDVLRHELDALRLEVARLTSTKPTVGDGQQAVNFTPDEDEHVAKTSRLESETNVVDGHESAAFGPRRPTSFGAVVHQCDDWITKCVHENSSNVAGRYHSSVDPVQCIEPFGGDPRKWDMFIGSFRALVHDVMPSNAVRIAYLQRLLSPQVRDSISSYLYNPDLYLDALADLKLRYGDRQLIAQYNVKALRAIRTMKDEGLVEIDRFSCELHGIVTSLLKTGCEAEVFAAGNIFDVVAKLTPPMREKWCERARYLSGPVDLQALDDWLCNEVRTKRSAAIFECLDERTVLKPKPLRANRAAGVHLVVTEGSMRRCTMCNENHALDQCHQFNGMPVSERLEFVKRKRCCFLCLKFGHCVRKCRLKITCSVSGCSERHNRLLHGSTFRSTSVSTEVSNQGMRQVPGEVLNVTRVGTFAPTRTTLLSVIPVVIRSCNKSVKTHALLDSGSEATLITEDLVQQLGLSRRSTAVGLITFHGNQPVATSAVSFSLGSLDGTYWRPVDEAYTVSELKLSHRGIDLSAEKDGWSHVADIQLEDVDYSDVKVLIGVDQFEVHRQLEVRSPTVQGLPYAVRGPLGWMFTGPMEWKRKTTDSRRQVNRVVMRRSEGHDVQCEDVTAVLERFWSTESFGVKLDATRPKSPEEERANRMLKRLCVKRDGRYQVGLLWKREDVVMPDNRIQAVGRLNALRKRLMKDEKMFEAYAAEIRRLTTSGIARMVLPKEIEVPRGKVWYLPHHAVEHPMKPGKTRIVFDGSATFRGRSLNSCLLKGPTLLKDLGGLLLRFRRFAVPVVADIDKMFHQVMVPTEDQSVLRFVWQPNENGPIDTYQMMRQVFGLVSAPASCMFALRQCLLDSGQPDVCQRALEQFYVDNYIDSFVSERDAINYQAKLTSVLKDGGFTLSKWASTSRRLLMSCPLERLSFPWVDLNRDPLPLENALGLRWLCEEDCFIFCSDIVNNNVLTRRQLVSAVSKIFDPLGLIAPVVIEAKMIMRDACEGVDWDDEVTSEQRKRYMKWLRELQPLNGLAIPRWVGLTEERGGVQLHVFSDASERAFGAAAYLRLPMEGHEVKTSLLMAKSRLAPKRSLTIPCLELQAAVMATRLSATIKRELHFGHMSTTFWSDSTTVLQWIASQKKNGRVFVENRVAEILELSTVNQWRHIPGHLNPADDLSRGLCPAKLDFEHRWFNGPRFLKMDESTWPKWHVAVEDSTRYEVVSHVSTVSIFVNPLEKLFLRMSNFKSILRVVAYMLRFVRRNERTASVALSAQEVNAAKIVCLRSEQLVHFGEEVNMLLQHGMVRSTSRLAPLGPFLDESQTIRVGGRLKVASIANAIKHPVIVSPSSTLTIRMVWDRHLQLMHAGCERVLADLRSEMWILSGRRCVRSVLKGCLYCRRLTAKPSNAKMANLPSVRVDFGQPAFSNVGVDFFGPIEVCVGRSKAKRYGLIFTCLTSRACHLEVTHSIDVHSVINALRRFIARRGCPRIIVSDNGKSFVAVSRLMEKEINHFLVGQGIEWKFNPPGGPHHGGAWERLIAVAKKALAATLHGNSVNDETLLTVFADVEALLNRRPLTYLSDDPDCVEPLTPFHIIIGRQNVSVPADIIECDVSLRRHWKTAQVIVDRFWKRWLREYLPTLQRRHKWLEGSTPIKVGDFVAVIQPNAKRNDWMTGRVTGTTMASDGFVRRVMVKTKDGTYERPITSIALLESC